MNSLKNRTSRILISTTLLLSCLPHTASLAQTKNRRPLNSQASLFDFALKEANQLKDIDIRQQVLAHIAEKYAEARQFEPALALVEKLPAWHQARIRTRIGVSLWKAGQTQEAERQFQRVRNMKPGMAERGLPTVGYERLRDLVAAYSEIFQYAKAIETANAISDESYRIIEFETILGHYFSVIKATFATSGSTNCSTCAAI